MDEHDDDDDTRPVASQASSMIMPILGGSAVDTRSRKWELEHRNRPLTDSDLDAILPSKGYTVLSVPANYKPVRSQVQQRTSLAAPAAEETSGFAIQETIDPKSYGLSLESSVEGDGNMPHIKPEDYEYFGKLVEEEEGSKEGDDEEAKEKAIMLLLLKIKNGTPPQRKVALRQIADKAIFFGAEALFNQILPLLMSPMLEDQERHLLVKVIDRVLYKLKDQVRPFVHKILVVIEPLLIDEDYYARMEGREIISTLSKAAGLATMISVMREDIDNPDEYARNTTSRAFAVVASALGIPSLLPFLKAVCTSKKSWEAKHTGIKIVQQIAILMGSSTLAHLKMLVEIVQGGLTDEHQKVRIMTAQALASLAEAAYPYGIEAFDSVLRSLWFGVKQHRQKALCSFLAGLRFHYPAMEDEHAGYYTREIMVVVVREFSSPDEEMKKVVLKVVQQCVTTDGVDAAYVREAILPHFFKTFGRGAWPWTAETVKLSLRPQWSLQTKWVPPTFFRISWMT